MTFGIVGLGRMGLSLGELAVERGHEVVSSPGTPRTRHGSRAEKDGMRPLENLGDAPAGLSSPRAILLWVPRGKPVDQNLERFLPSPEAGDVVADCGSSFWGGLSRAGREHRGQRCARPRHRHQRRQGRQKGGIGLSPDMPPDPSQTSTDVEDTDEVKWVVK